MPDLMVDKAQRTEKSRASIVWSRSLELLNSGRGGRRCLALDRVVDYIKRQVQDLLAVHQALDRLAQVVIFRYLGGMTVAEVAALVGVSVATVEHD